MDKNINHLERILKRNLQVDFHSNTFTDILFHTYKLIL